MAAVGEFRKAKFGGFNKDDVIEYIKNLNRTSKENEEQLNTQISELKKSEEGYTLEKENLLKRINELESEVKVLKEEKKAVEDAETALKLKMESSVAELNDEIKKGKLALQEKEHDLSEASIQIMRLKKDNKKLETKFQMLEDSRKKYEKFNSHFGTIVAEAHAQAEKIIDNASLEYDNISESSLNVLRFFTDEFVNLKSRIELFQTAFKNADKAKRDMDEAVEKISECLDGISDGVTNELGIMKEKREKVESGDSREKRKPAFKIDLAIIDEMLNEDVPKYDEEEFSVNKNQA